VVSYHLNAHENVHPRGLRHGPEARLDGMCHRPRRSIYTVHSGCKGRPGGGGGGGVKLKAACVWQKANLKQNAGRYLNLLRTQRALFCFIEFLGVSQQGAFKNTAMAPIFLSMSKALYPQKKSRSKL
jgi:hypothetical protein